MWPFPNSKTSHLFYLITFKWSHSRLLKCFFQQCGPFKHFWHFFAVLYVLFILFISIQVLGSTPSHRPHPLLDFFINFVVVKFFFFDFYLIPGLGQHLHPLSKGSLHDGVKGCVGIRICCILQCSIILWLGLQLVGSHLLEISVVYLDFFLIFWFVFRYFCCESRLSSGLFS